MVAIFIREISSFFSPVFSFIHEINRNGDHIGKPHIRRGVKLCFHANFPFCFTKSVETATMIVNNIFLEE